MSARSDERQGAGESGDAPRPEAPARDEAAGSSGATIVRPTRAPDQLLYERRSKLFKAPTGGLPPKCMATAEQVESFRDLRTRLLLLAAGAGVTHFTTMVVAVSEGSGASFVTRNLAAAFTLEKRVALLVDCNFRNPTQHRALDIENADGLLDFLLAPDEVPIDELIRPTAVPGLHLVPAGMGDRRPGAPHEHFSSPPMKALLSWLRDEPCHVLLDGPPVEGSPDARILADLADFVVLVVGYGRTTPSALARAAGLFDRKKLAGVVFNDALASRGGNRGRDAR